MRHWRLSTGAAPEGVAIRAWAATPESGVGVRPPIRCSRDERRDMFGKFGRHGLPETPGAENPAPIRPSVGERPGTGRGMYGETGATVCEESS